LERNAIVVVWKILLWCIFRTSMWRWTRLDWIAWGYSPVVGSHEYGEFLDLRIACSVLMLDFVRL